MSSSPTSHSMCDALFDLLPASEPMRALWVGMGGISATMLKFLMPQPWARATAVVDIRPAALDAAQQQLNLSDDALFTDLGRALAAVGEHGANVAIINTPSELHYDQVQAALRAGLHVLVAKPITNDFEQAVELVELAAAQRRSLCVGQQMRYNRHYSSVRRYLATGDLGSVEMINFLSAKPRHKALNLATMTQPTLYEMSCHHFDSLLSLMPGAAPDWIMIDGFRPSWSVYAGPCSLNGLIRFVDGPHVLYHGGFSSQADLYELRMEGSNGALRCRGLHMSNDIMAVDPRLLPLTGGEVLADGGRRGKAEVALQQPCDYVAYEGAVVPSQRAGVLLAVPGQRSHTWFIRDYGLATYNPTMEQPVQIAAGGSWQVGLRVVAYDGTLDETRARAWLDSVAAP